VYCYSNAGTSAARAILDLARGQRGTPTLLTVHLEPPAVGDIGVELDQGGRRAHRACLRPLAVRTAMSAVAQTAGSLPRSASSAYGNARSVSTG